jgi:hypothetical protein
MPKSKAPQKKSKTTKPATRKKQTVKAPVHVKAKPTKEPQYSSEYRDYLQRYALVGAGRPQLSPKEFDDLDDELLDLLALEGQTRLDDEQNVRLQELEYLLLDSEA